MPGPHKHSYIQPVPLQQHWRWWSRDLRDLCKECYLDLKAYSLSALLYPLGWKRSFSFQGFNPSTLTEAQAEQAVNIFLHGSLANPSSWLPIGRFLQQHPVGPCFTLQYGSIPDGIQKLSLLLRQVKEQYRTLGKNTLRVNLIGHSKGAMTAVAFRLFHQALHPPGVILEKTIAIAGRLRVHPTRTQLFHRKETALLYEIHSRLTRSADDIQLHVLMGAKDRLVPLSSMLVPAAPERQRLIPSCGHLSILYCPQAHEQIYQWLTAR
jgi:pimeloyl-ACP methyl ester carboxylesterase